MKHDDRPRWLDDPRHVTWLWRLLLCLGLIVSLIEPLINMHPRFDIENEPFFYDWYPFLSYTFIVLFSRQLRKLLWRPPDYYERDAEEDE